MSDSAATSRATARGQYNETQLRREFLDPFFEALGWDVYNRKGYAEAYKEVIHEDAIQHRRPDQGPRLLLPRRRRHAELLRRGQEALGRYPRGDQPGLPAAPLRLVGQAAGEHSHRFRGVGRLRLPHPAGKERQGVHRADHLPSTTRDYLERWDELYDLFSPEAIRRGSLEKLVASKKIKKGTAEVDAAFLGEIESWRDVLARNLALRNPGIIHRDLNFAVQRTIDRIVFLRICEDRGIETYGRLAGAGQRRRTSIAGWRELVPSAPTSATTPACSISARSRTASEPPDEMTLGPERSTTSRSARSCAASISPKVPTSSPCSRPRFWARSTSSFWAR